MTDQELGRKLIETVEAVMQAGEPFGTSPGRADAEAALGRFLRVFANEVANAMHPKGSDTDDPA